MITSTTGPAVPVGDLSNGLWVAEVHVSSKWYAHPDDERTPRPDRPLTLRSRQWAQVLGVRRDELTVLLVRERETTPDMYHYQSIERDVQLVSSKPFVVVLHDDPDEHYNYTRYRYVAAQQVHHGERGRKPRLRVRPGVVASAMRDPDDNKRTLNWVQLGELAEMLGISPEELLRDYAKFSPSTVYEPNVPLACGPRSQVADRADLELLRLYIGRELPHGYCGGETAWGGRNADTLDARLADAKWNPYELWVPQSFAYCVIRLVGFGYLPRKALHGNVCRVGAPMPEQPEPVLPVLTPEQLRDLHQLRMGLDKELTRVQFQQAALSALGYPRSTVWQQAPESTDQLNGFAYYMNFRQMSRATADGLVVIGVCDTTRAVGTGEYYAGYLAVFAPDAVITDARRDPALLRIWFWPGELVRTTPDGRLGGLCPPCVPNQCAPLVERFLLNLGYYD